jgi:hypothetical protein
MREGRKKGTHVVLLDDFDEPSVVEVGEVACRILIEGSERSLKR